MGARITDRRFTKAMTPGTSYAIPVVRRRRDCISSTKDAIKSTAGGMLAVGLAAWYWRYRFIVTLSIRTKQAGAAVLMAEARSPSVVSGPTTKVWMLNLFC